jgi:hypothetical protein
VHAANQTAVDTQWDDFAGDVRRMAWADIAKARQQTRADQIEVSHDDCAEWQ